MNYAIAVKSFIINDNGELLLIQRRSDDAHKPGRWDIPGGRLDPGENPFDGLKREAKEEVNLDIEIKIPIDIQHFTRDDGQLITMIIFLCKPITDKIKLSEEHTGHKWLDINSAADAFPEWLRPSVNNFKKHIRT